MHLPVSSLPPFLVSRLFDVFNCSILTVHLLAVLTIKVEQYARVS